jgi:hypothetical protein
VAGLDGRIKESLNSGPSLMELPFDYYCTGHRHAGNRYAWRHISRRDLYTLFTGFSFKAVERRVRAI